MKAKLIVMLTHHDKTVEDASDIFESCKDLPVDCWGFKNIGLSEVKMAQLAKRMAAAGKQIFIEDVLNEEEEVLRLADFAVRNEVNGIFARYYPSVQECLRKGSIDYYCCSTKSSGIPVLLRGPIADIIHQLKEYMEKGADGICIGAYRHESDPHGLIEALSRNIRGKVIIAGSINNKRRLEEVERTGCYGFTVGSALFDKVFVPKGSFRDNLIELLRVMDQIE